MCILAKNREAMDTEKTSVDKLHDVFEEGSSQAGLTIKCIDWGPNLWRFNHALRFCVYNKGYMQQKPLTCKPHC
jgi:hypothetical protein